MPDYCTVADVRSRMPEVDTAEWNTEIEGCIEQAMSEADDLLRRYATVPLTGTIPDSVKHGTADIAAAIFRSRRVPDGKLPVLYEQGKKRIQGYINSTYRSGTLVR